LREIQTFICRFVLSFTEGVMKKTIILCIFAALAFGCRPMDAPAPPQEKPQDKQDESGRPDEPDKPDTPDATDPFESAAEAVLNMGAGWNLGNTLDTNSGDTNNMWIEAWTSRTPKDYETSWGQPETTRELIHMFKEAGFGVIRVPVTWYPHMGTITLHDQNKWNPATWTGTRVDPLWMARVKEVVDYVIDEGMYCILNVHHDTGDATTAWLRASEDGFNAAKADTRSSGSRLPLHSRTTGRNSSLSRTTRCWTSTAPGALHPWPLQETMTQTWPGAPTTPSTTTPDCSRKLSVQPAARGRRAAAAALVASLLINTFKNSEKEANIQFD
jgi:hypothetical protein